MLKHVLQVSVLCYGNHSHSLHSYCICLLCGGCKTLVGWRTILLCRFEPPKRSLQIKADIKILSLSYLGMNSIVLYLGHEMAFQMLPFHYIIGPMRTHWANLPEALWGTGLWLIIAYILYKNKVFITVWRYSFSRFTWQGKYMIISAEQEVNIKSDT